MDKKDLLTRSEVARLLQVSFPTILDWTKKGILKSYKLGRRVYFKADEIDQCLKATCES